MIKIWTREEYYKKHWNKKHIYWKEDCPFCKLEEQAWHTIWKWKNWFVLHNLYSYTWDKMHIMAVPYRHILYSTDLNDEEISELKDVYKIVKDFFWEKDYFSCTRESMANRSIEHLHMQFIAWKLQWKYLRKMLQNQGFPIVQDLDV